MTQATRGGKPKPGRARKPHQGPASPLSLDADVLRTSGLLLLHQALNEPEPAARPILMYPEGGVERNPDRHEPAEHQLARWLVAELGHGTGDSILITGLGIGYSRNQVAAMILRLAMGHRLPTLEEVREHRRIRARRALEAPSCRRARGGRRRCA